MSIRKNHINQPGFNDPINYHTDYIEYRLDQMSQMLTKLQESVNKIGTQSGSGSSQKEKGKGIYLLPPPAQYGIAPYDPPAPNYQKSKFLELEDKKE